VESGRLRQGQRALCIHRSGAREEFRVAKILGFQSLKRFELAEAAAGDICAVTGMEDLAVGETITETERPVVLPLLDIEEPTVKMYFIANNGPFAGTEGKYVTSRNLRERLLKETKSNIALRVRETESPDTFEVLGRGELHLTVLIETMRRESYELTVSQPQVIFREGEDGERLEPYEEVVIDLDEAFAGAVIEELGRRGGRMQEMAPAGTGRMRLEYLAPARGLIGYRSQFLTDTRGTGILHHNFKHYGPYAGAIKSRPSGVLIAQDPGETNTYALFYLQERGQLFLGPGVKVYGGQIIGQHSRDNDLIVNPSKSKKLTNIRTTAADEKLFLTPPRVFTLESALELINDDELVEATPKSIRLRKRILDHNERKRVEKLRDGGRSDE
jgi:GTP-binding protein